MNNKRTGFCVIGLLAAWLAVPTSAGEPSSVSSLEDMVRQWTDLRLQLAEEQRQWDEGRQHGLREVELLKKEAAALEAVISESREFAATAERERTELLARRDAMETALRDIEPILDRAEAVLRQWGPRLPVTPAAPLRDAFARLPRDQADAVGRRLSQRLQLVVALFTQIESMQHAIHVVKEVVPLADGRREMDVLYLGLARAFAVAPDNEQAAVGEPGSQGWQWASAPTLAPQIRQAIAVANSEEPATLIELPLLVTRDIQDTPLAPKQEP